MSVKRRRRPKLFRVTREERTLVTFYVETTSALKARNTPTPTSIRYLVASHGHRVGDAGHEQCNGSGR